MNDLTDKVQIELKNKCLLIKLAGKCEAGLANLLYEETQKYLNKFKNSKINAIISFKDVSHASSTALSVLVMIKKMIQKNKGRAAITNVNGYLMKILKVIDVENLFELFNTFEDAKASFGCLKK